MIIIKGAKNIGKLIIIMVSVSPEIILFICLYNKVIVHTYYQ